MFLSVEWAKRWLPAVFLLLSLLLPWWTLVEIDYFRLSKVSVVYLDSVFPWGYDVRFCYHPVNGEIWGRYKVRVSEIPLFCFVSALVVIAGLCGLSSKSKTRTLGGLLGIVGVASSFILVFIKSLLYPLGWNPYFGIAHDRFWLVDPNIIYTYIWFLSVGFYLALSGSLMLLLPLIRTLVERLRKRL